MYREKKKRRETKTPRSSEIDVTIRSLHENRIMYGQSVSDNHGDKWGKKKEKSSIFKKG